MGEWSGGLLTIYVCGGGEGVGGDGIRYWFTLRGGEYEWGKYDGTLANHWVGAPEGEVELLLV